MGYGFIFGGGNDIINLKINERRYDMKTCIIKMIWDDGAWCAESNDELGIVLESSSFDTLVERVRIAVPEMLELNCDYIGEVRIIFETERIDTLKAVV